MSKKVTKILPIETLACFDSRNISGPRLEEENLKLQKDLGHLVELVDDLEVLLLFDGRRAFLKVVHRVANAAC